MKDSRISLFYMLICGISVMLLVGACARMSSPDGGPYDQTPPVMVHSQPALGALNYQKKRIELEFDEYIKLENAAEKVVISPPQNEVPEIKTSGKKVSVELFDSIKLNTTYSLDFGDAIVDNNEGNPMGQFTFTFSTGDVIDSMAIGGTVLDASNLEPIKGMQVGLYADLSDTAFISKPFERVARTDSRGHFSIRGVAPGKYKIYGLKDSDQNYYFNQKSEMIAFLDSVIIPDYTPAVRMDTLWIDSLTIDTIKEVHYTRFLPDDLILRAFKEEMNNQYLIKNERLTPKKFSFYFAAKSDSLPLIQGLNFNEKEAFVLEKNSRNDTLHYWIKDSSVYNLDTLEMSLTYLYTDTLGQLVPRTDTLYMTSKKTRAMIQKELDKEMEAFQKELKRRRKRSEEPLTDTLPPTKFINFKVSPTGTTDVNRIVTFEFEEPLASYNENAIHLKHKVDTLWQDIPYIFEPVEGELRKYRLLAEWRPEQEYELQIDSLCFVGLYGLHTDDTKYSLKMRSLDDYGTLAFDVKGKGLAKGAFIELLKEDKPIQRTVLENGHADFFFLTPGKYYARLINDRNGNGKWDTGLYTDKLQPEEVYYYPQSLDVRALWDIRQDWDIFAIPMEKQKPLEITKQKPDGEKKIKDRNAERERMKRR